MIPNPVIGRVSLLLNGESRTLFCDMSAIALLEERLGEHWLIWLFERFVGREEKRDLGGKSQSVRVPEKIKADEFVSLTFALLAADREDSGRQETEKDIRRAIGPGNYFDVRQALTQAFLASFGVKGEEVRVVESAEGGPHGNARA